MAGRCRQVAIACGLTLALACAAAPAASAAPDTTTWLCKPGITANPCKPGFDTTRISPDGEVLGVDRLTPDRKKKVDCFYVYPTVSDDPTPNSDLEIDPEERSIALYQAARYALHCRMFAPIYRQLTLATITTGGSITEEQAQLAYDDVVRAWKTYLSKYNNGRGVILLGHSQGTYMLRPLIREYIDNKPGVRKRLVSALLLGGNVAVAEGSNVGGDFKHVPGCESPKQIGCVIGFSTFNAPVPADARFGRPGNQARPRRSAPRRRRALQQPGGARRWPRHLAHRLSERPVRPGDDDRDRDAGGRHPAGAAVTTPWVQSEAYTGECSSADDADVLQIAPIGGAPVLRPIPEATWGLHLVDANIALGNLTAVVKRQIKAYVKALEP